jgi:Flp pilus assembly protein TadD
MIRKYMVAFMLTIPLFADAADTDTTPVANHQNNDFVVGKKALENKSWQAAADAFNRAVTTEPRNADIHNYLGYSYRNMDQIDLSFKHYNEALKLDPNHRGAHEYIGWAYLKTDKLSKAEEHLMQLEKICGRACEEYTELSTGIGNYKAKK